MQLNTVDSNTPMSIKALLTQGPHCRLGSLSVGAESSGFLTKHIVMSMEQSVAPESIRALMDMGGICCLQVCSCNGMSSPPVE